MKTRQLKEKIFHLLIFLCTITGLIVLLVLLYDIFKSGIKLIDIDFLRNYASRIPERAGIRAPLLGTIWIMVITILVSAPIGIGTAIYLEEYAKKGRIKYLIEVNISNLAGVPSIVYGMLGLGVFVITFGFGRSILSGALTLSLLILPVIIVSSQEALKSVPKDLKESGYGLGLTKWQVIKGIILPYSMPSILTGNILALSRAIGETAPLMMIGAVSFIAFSPKGVFDSFSVLPMQIYGWTTRSQIEFHNLAAAAIMVLLIILFVMNGIAIIIRNKYEDRMKG